MAQVSGGKVINFARSCLIAEVELNVRQTPIADIQNCSAINSEQLVLWALCAC